MAIKDLFFTLFAKDQTGAAFAAVNENLRKTEGHAASVSDRMGRMGKAMQRVGAAGSIASIGLGSAFRDVLGLYDEQARSEAKVVQAIKATGGAAGFTADQLKAQASALQSVTRFGDEAILNKVTAQLLTFKDITGDTFVGAQRAALDLATVLDGDLQSASIMLGKALNDPATGLSAMSRAGVTFTEEQKEVIKQLQATGDIAGAQKLILDEIASAYGGQAEAARATGTGMVQAWSNTWGDIKEIIGGVILEFLPPILDGLQSMATAFQNLSPTGQKFAVVLGVMAVAVPPLVAAVGTLVIGLTAVSAPVLAVVAGVAALTAGLVAFWPQVSSGIEYLRGLWGELSTVEKAFAPPAMAVRALWDAFEATFPNIAGMVSDTVSGIVEVFRGKFLSIMDAVGEKIGWVNDKFAWLYDKVVGNSWVPDLVDEIGASFGMLEGNMVKPTDDATKSVNGSFKGLLGDVKGSLRTMATEGTLTFDNFLGGLADIALKKSKEIQGNLFDQAFDATIGGLFGGTSTGATSGKGATTGGGLLGGVGSFLSGLVGFDTGGAFTVRGRAGMDRNVAAVRLSEGEEVQVSRRGQASGQTVVNVTIQATDLQSFQRSRAQIAAQMSQAIGAAGRVA